MKIRVGDIVIENQTVAGMAMLSKHDDRVHKGIQAIVLDYQSRGFKVVSAFGDGAFDSIINWHVP